MGGEELRDIKAKIERKVCCVKQVCQRQQIFTAANKKFATGVARAMTILDYDQAGGIHSCNFRLKRFVTQDKVTE